MQVVCVSVREKEGQEAHADLSQSAMPAPPQPHHDDDSINYTDSNSNSTTTHTTDAYTYHGLPGDDYRHDSHSRSQSSHGGSSSPVAPAYSPITPKVQPVLPATIISPDENSDDWKFGSVVHRPQQERPHQQPARSIESHPPPPAASRIPPAEYIPQPPSLPFSSDDAGDAIALRAAISTLQFQKKKAQSDIKTLASIKQLALDDPETFKDELAAGRVSEQRPNLGSLRAILDNIEDGDSDDEVVLGASREDEDQPLPAEVPDSQPSQEVKMEPEDGAQKQFPRIPGPQTIVRMPHVNWGKYGIAGEPLESLHEQQQRWPGSFGQGDKGREYTVAAPYSPFVDSLDDQQQQSNGTDGSRKDSGPAPSLTGTISEHVMETRSRN